MSGIVGIINTDGAPVDRRLLAAMNDSLTFRGPDAQNIWTAGPVGFGHTLLVATEEAFREKQPFSLDGQVWITADARVDARPELIRQLETRGRQGLGGATDAELILHSYHVWKEDCVDHLLGDFAFAIWDAASQQLFCARDHFGVKPFFYSQQPASLIFSNTLNCIRLHPAVSDGLDDLAIADFLLFEVNQDLAGSIFSDIRRLPPAHTLTWSRNQIRLRRYWTLPIDEPVYYRRRDEYIELFRHLLRETVSDRLRTNRVNVFMSGGLDSPLLAATARDLLGVPSAVSAFTCVYNDLIEDDERHYAGLVATHLGIPIQFQAVDEISRLDYSRHDLVRSPEPVASPWLWQGSRSRAAEMESIGRVAFYGEGPDNALYYEWRPHLRYLLRQGRWRRLLLDVGSYVREHRRIPLVAGIPNRIRKHGKDASAATFPSWLNEDFSSRFDLRSRWTEFESRAVSPHAVRPAAYRSFQSPLWQQFLEGLDAASTGVALETRHPYLDVRMVRFFFTVPALPWCMGKHLLREAGRGILPEEVRCRPKTPLRQDPLIERARREGRPGFASATPRLREYVNFDRLSRSVCESNAELQFEMRLEGLDSWFHGLLEETHKFDKEISHDVNEFARAALR